MSKVHIGCGSVYLSGWINVDLPSPRTFLASERPDLVEQYITTEDNYYGRHTERTKSHAALAKDYYVCDRYGDFMRIPVTGPVSEILTRQTFEHLSITEARLALDNMFRVMQSGAILRISVPDHEGTLRAFKLTGDEFYIRHLLGPRDSDVGFHMMSYCQLTLQCLVCASGFEFIEVEPNIHFYPAICLRFKKP